MELHAKIYIAGHNGLVGSALLRLLRSRGYDNLVMRSRQELDLRNGEEVKAFFDEESIDYVFLAAAKVGGILANDTYPAEFIRDNLLMATNIIDSAYRSGVRKLLNLGSTCIYPKLAPQPLKESYLLTGELESTNEPYAIAKIAAIKMCQAYNRQYGTRFISVMPTNLYGPNDRFDLNDSHVLPALLRKFHEAKEKSLPSVLVWGTGSPRRDFLHVDDLADACLYLMEQYEGSEIVNVGMGEDLTIQELAERIQRVVGYEGDITFDTSKPDGTPRKLADTSKLFGMGWEPAISLDEGLTSTYLWFLERQQVAQV
ncbi:GDP-L-fucose synthase family protein [Paenibacillus glycanilyticus]|uniref:GDP-L-fucose synthase family protein n=1 Tax=Paenibacillus glycanilyticus TaxID=126569 RepID=UPI0027E56D3E|nr:GDP-L-fucose synthase [Paenibacillus glycanilyticus]